MASLDDMALFAAVIQAGSFTAAANSLGVPLSTVSRRVAQLEQQLGTRLLERTTRSLKPTDAGRVYYEHCEQLVSQAREAEYALQRLQREPSGHLRFTTPFAVDDSWAMALISSFLAKYPKITLETCLQLNGMEAEEGDADVQIHFGPKPRTHHPVQPLGRARLGLCASPQYVARHGMPATPEELPAHALIRFTLLRWPEFAPPAFRELKLDYRITTNDLLMARKACVDGMGIAWLPLVISGRLVKEGLLVPLMTAHQFTLPLWIVSRSQSRSTPKVNAFVEHLLSLLGSPHAWEMLESGGWFDSLSTEPG